MIIGLIRNVTIIFLILTLIYAVLTFINRAKKRDELKDEFIRADTHLSRDDYVNRGMEDYNASLKAKLLLGVYIVPVLVLAVLYYLANYV